MAERTGRLIAVGWRTIRNPDHGPVTLFRAASQPKDMLDPSLGWAEFARGGLHIIAVGGTHVSIMAEHRLAALGEAMSARWRRWGDRPVTSSPAPEHMDKIGWAPGASFPQSAPAPISEMPPRSPASRNDEVHVWRVWPDIPLGMLEQRAACLTAEERDRACAPSANLLTGADTLPIGGVWGEPGSVLGPGGSPD